MSLYLYYKIIELYGKRIFAVVQYQLRSFDIAYTQVEHIEEVKSSTWGHLVRRTHVDQI